MKYNVITKCCKCKQQTVCREDIIKVNDKCKIIFICQNVVKRGNEDGMLQLIPPSM